MDIPAGEIHAIIGPNGAGKSTVLNLLSGLYAPDTGTVGFGVADRAPRARDLARLGISRTFQNLALFNGLDVARNVALGRRAHVRAGLVAQLFDRPRARSERRDVERRTYDALAFFGLETFARRQLEGLPYGVRKRIELARAIVAEPTLLLLDEPFAGMTGSEKPEMAALIRAIRDTFGTTIVLIEHDVEIVMGLAERITVLDHGRFLAVGTPAEIRRHPAVIAAYFGQGDEGRAA